MTPPKFRPTAKEMLFAAICLAVVLGGAFIAAPLIKHLFSLAPLTFEGKNIEEAKRLDLSRTFVTAWAALVLVTPALCTFLFHRSSETAARYWLAFWTVSFLAFLVHFCWAFVVMFDSQWGDIFKTPRVSAPWPDLIFVVWWGIDVLLAWFLQSEGLWVRIQRALVHLLAFVLFFLGSAKEGELCWSRALGMSMGVTVLIFVVIWFIRWLKRPKQEIGLAV